LTGETVHRFTANILKKKCILPALVNTFLILFIACPARTVEPSSLRDRVNNTSEYEIKAIYLYNFLKFVQWPENSCMMHDGRSHRIGVLGDSPFNEVLRDLQEKLREKDKDLEIFFYGPYRESMDLSCCCLLFITSTEKDNLADILSQLEGRPVLTVADTDGFFNQGVMITLVSQKNKIRWVINRQPVAESGLKLNSKLLDIAVKVINK